MKTGKYILRFEDIEIEKEITSIRLTFFLKMQTL